MINLKDLFNYYGSDKSTNGYSDIYECLFHPLRHKPIRFLEIGIGTMIPGMLSSMHGYAPDSYKPGASLRAWRDYFTNGSIYGLDLQPDTQFTETRIQTIQSDSRNPMLVSQELARLSLYEFDVILDDGSHLLSDQIATLQVMFKYLKPGGIWITEDIHVPNADNFIIQANELLGKLPMFLLYPKGAVCVIRNLISSPAIIK
jgi:hypothetical protein